MIWHSRDLVNWRHLGFAIDRPGMLDYRGLGVSLVPDWVRPWPEGLSLVRIALPLPCEPRRIAGC